MRTYGKRPRSLRMHKRNINISPTSRLGPRNAHYPPSTLSILSGPLLSNIFLTFLSPTLLPSESRAQSISPCFRIPLCTRPKSGMPTYGSWTVRIEKGVVRFKLLGGGTCFTMSSNSGVMVMLAEAVSVLGVGRKELALNLMRKREADWSGPGTA